MPEQIYVDCDLCKKRFESGHGKYYGSRIPAWDAMLCRGCIDNNWDGIVTNKRSNDFVQKLEAKGAQLDYNDQGHLIIPI